MDSNIKSTIEQCSKLRLQVNKGERHRIMHSAVKRGSLWVEPRRRSYNILPTGEVKSLLHDFIFSRFGPEKGESRPGKYWELSNCNDVAEVIRRFNRS